MSEPGKPVRKWQSELRDQARKLRAGAEQWRLLDQTAENVPEEDPRRVTFETDPAVLQHALVIVGIARQIELIADGLDRPVAVSDAVERDEL
jgi:hypothetical protein